MSLEGWAPVQKNESNETPEGRRVRLGLMHENEREAASQHSGRAGRMLHALALLSTLAPAVFGANSAEAADEKWWHDPQKQEQNFAREGQLLGVETDQEKVDIYCQIKEGQRVPGYSIQKHNFSGYGITTSGERLVGPDGTIYQMRLTTPYGSSEVECN